MKKSSTLFIDMIYGNIMLFVSSLIFFLDYILKFLPTAINDLLILKFQLNEFQISLFFAAYVYPYSIMQLFVGPIVDRFGLYITLTLSSILCALGALCMCHANSISILYASRIIIGIGASFCVVNGSKICSLLINSKYSNLAFSIFISFGVIGGAFGLKLTNTLLNYMSWRLLSISLCIIFLLICLMILIFFKNYRNHSVKKISPYKKLSIREIISAISNKKFLRISLFSALSFSSAMVIASSCKKLFSYHFNDHLSENILMSVLIGLVVGSFVIGYLTTKIKNERQYSILMYLSTILQLIILCSIYWVSYLSYTVVLLQIFTFGVLTSAGVIALSLARDTLSQNMSGMASGVSNFINTLIEASSISICGFIIYIFNQDINTSFTPITCCVVMLIAAIIFWPYNSCKS